MTCENKLETSLVPLTVDHIGSAWQLFADNQKRYSDITVDLWVDEPCLFVEQFEAICTGPSDCKIFVILHEDRVIGFIDSSPEKKSTRIGYIIDAAYEGKGIMKRHLSEAISQLPHPVEARILEDNVRSIHLVERLGFIKKNKIDADYSLWELI